MGIIATDLVYQLDSTIFNGMLAYDDAVLVKRPLVMVMHDWSGCNEFAIEKAKALAKMGYVGFAIDLYGERNVGKTNDEKKALMAPLMQDRRLLLRRLCASLEAGREHTQVHAASVAAIGFCFGGLCALDLARSGMKLNGVVSFHGLLNAPDSHQSKKMHAKVLVLHGYDDPMVPPAAVQSFAAEMTQAQADWQVHMYGNTMHAFMNPEAHDVSIGTVYDAVSSRRAWQSTEIFLKEIF